MDKNKTSEKFIIDPFYFLSTKLNICISHSARLISYHSKSSLFFFENLESTFQTSASLTDEEVSFDFALRLRVGPVVAVGAVDEILLQKLEAAVHDRLLQSFKRQIDRDLK